MQSEKGHFSRGLNPRRSKGGLVRGLHLVEEKEVMDVPGLAMPLVGDSKNLGRRRVEPQAHVGTSANTYIHTHTPKCRTLQWPLWQISLGHGGMCGDYLLTYRTNRI